MTAILIYMTCPDEAEAEKIVSSLLESCLIACANIMPPHRSFYRWKGKVENATETAVIMKSRAELFEKIRQMAVDMHSYECPCLVAVQITDGHTAFLQWIKDETI